MAFAFAILHGKVTYAQRVSRLQSALRSLIQRNVNMLIRRRCELTIDRITNYVELVGQVQKHEALKNAK